MVAAVREAIAKRTDIALGKVQLDAVVPRPENLVAVEVDRTIRNDSVMMQAQRITEAGQRVVTDHVALADDDDAFEIPYARIGGRPRRLALEQVVADVVVELGAANAVHAIRHVRKTQPARHEILRATEVHAPGARSNRQVLDRDVAAGDVDAVSCAGRIEDRAVAARAADEDRIACGAAAADRN